MSQETVLIIGSSGNVGGELARLLRNGDCNVRLATSKATTNKEQVQLNLVTGEGVKNAFDGVDKAFLLAPPGYADQYSILSPLVQEAKRRGLKKVVLMTAMGANAVETSPFRRVEIELEKSGLSYNIIRPNWFFQNFNTFWIEGILKQNKILLPAGTAKVGFIDARDIAAVAATLLTSTKFNNKDFDITGPESVDHSEVAKAISQVSGKNVTYQEIEPEVLKGGLLAAGLPADYVEFLLMILSYLKAGYSSATNENVQLITGKPARNLSQYTNDYKQSWK